MSYRKNEANHCPGCGRSQWIVGRTTAECAFCSTALPLAERGHSETPRIFATGKGGATIRRQMVAA
jgi:hypothetical protein